MIDTVNKMIYVCCAGAETVMIVRDKKVLAIKNSNESLRMDEDGTFTSVTQHIQSGDRILVCTDGLMDRKLKDGSHLFTPIETFHNNQRTLFNNQQTFYNNQQTFHNNQQTFHIQAR